MPHDVMDLFDSWRALRRAVNRPGLEITTISITADGEMAVRVISGGHGEVLTGPPTAIVDQLATLLRLAPRR